MDDEIDEKHRLDDLLDDDDDDDDMNKLDFILVSNCRIVVNGGAVANIIVVGHPVATSTEGQYMNWQLLLFDILDIIEISMITTIILITLQVFGMSTSTNAMVVCC
jgi:hypothetical protein